MVDRNKAMRIASVYKGKPVGDIVSVEEMTLRQPTWHPFVGKKVWLVSFPPLHIEGGLGHPDTRDVCVEKESGLACGLFLEDVERIEIVDEDE
jgi:hypothetical protein